MDEEQTRAAAKAGMTAPGADMVAVFAVAGFELADIFAEWARREVRLDTGALGPPYRTNGETPEAFGQRVARAILILIKEV